MSSKALQEVNLYNERHQCSQLNQCRGTRTSVINDNQLTIITWLFTITCFNRVE